MKFMELYLRGQNYRVLVVRNQGTMELRPGDSLEKPSAVYPTWNYGEDAEVLHYLCENPVGDDLELVENESLPAIGRPVLGQPHRVVIIGAPPADARIGRRFLQFIGDLQQEYPLCRLHLHGFYSYRAVFGSGVASGDVDPREDAARGRIITPAGHVVVHEATRKNPLWAHALGFEPDDLRVPRNRCIYNIRSALWAAERFTADESFGLTRRLPKKDDTRRMPVIVKPRGHQEKPTDRILCDVCTLVLACKYAREGSVCTVPDSETSRLSDFFNSRDPERIIDGLGALMSVQAKRLEKGLEQEAPGGELDPQVTKMASQIFEQGVKLAKLLDPTLARPGLTLHVNTGGGSAAIVNSNPAQLVAAVYAELEAQGMSRGDITPQIVQDFLRDEVLAEMPEKKELEIPLPVTPSGLRDAPLVVEMEPGDGRG